MDAEAFERRRYSAVMLWHPKLMTIRHLADATTHRLGDSVAVSLGHSGWTTRRAEWIANRSHYPQHIVDPKKSARSSGFAHDFYVSVRSEGLAEKQPLFLVASPYVRLLDVLIRTVTESLGRPVTSFVSVNMDEAVRYFEHASREKLRTKRVTLQMLSEVGLELVALSGNNPLHSDLLETLRVGGVAAPYSLGVDVEYRQRTRVNFDRHGNFWWYLSAESTMVNPLNLVDRLFSAGLLGSSRTSPLRRASEEELDTV